MEKSNELPNREHILACISSSPSNGKIINTAAQMATAFGGRFTALYVKTPASDNMTRENRERLINNMRLAEKYGADITTVYGEDVAEQIIEFARLSGVTKIVLGRSTASEGIFKRQTLTEKIIRSAPGLDIHIIPDTETKNKRFFYSAMPFVKFPSLKQCGWMTLILFLSTALGFMFHTLKFTEANTITVYMLGVLITALITKNYICSGVFSLVSVLIFNFFFTEPRLSFIAYESGYPVTFIIMLIVSLIMGTLANKLAVNAKLSANAAYRTNIMLETNQLLQKAKSEDDVINTMAEQLIKLLSRNIIVYPTENNKLKAPEIFTAPAVEAADELSTLNDRTTAHWVAENLKPAGTGTDSMPDAKGIYFPVMTNTIFCVVGIQVGNKAIEQFEKSILLSILSETALTIENLRNAEEKEQISLMAKNEQLRANLLRTISHDLRTPLTSISGNAENLLANFNNIDTDTRTKLLRDINEDSDWLISLVENLLSVSRISEGRININMSAQLADEVITESLRHIKRKTKGHQIITEFDDELLLAKMDARLISQVIINLVDNAIKYTPEGSEITVLATAQGDNIKISVEDNGPGIPDGQKQDVFRMFYTGNNTIADCRRSLGLGLSLCESIVNAHGSRLTLTDNNPHGCIFSFTLEKNEVKLNEQ